MRSASSTPAAQVRGGACRPDRFGVLPAAAGQHERQRGGVERRECGGPQGFRDLVESVQYGQDEAGVEERGGQCRSARDPLDQVGVVAQQPVGQPVVQHGGRRVPGAEAEDHGHPFEGGGVGQEVEDEPDRQDRLARTGPAEEDHPAGRDASVDLGDVRQIAVQIHGARRGPRWKALNVLGMVHQIGRCLMPSHRERIGIVDPALLLFELPAASDLLRQFSGRSGELARQPSR